jgi:hypothetical protein
MPLTHRLQCFYVERLGHLLELHEHVEAAPAGKDRGCVQKLQTRALVKLGRLLVAPGTMHGAKWAGWTTTHTRIISVAARP